MSISLNHTIVHVKDEEESARFFSEILGLPKPKAFGPFLVVHTENGVSLDFLSTDEPSLIEHYAFLVRDDSGSNFTVMDLTPSYFKVNR